MIKISENLTKGTVERRQSAFGSQQFGKSKYAHATFPTSFG